MELKYRDFSAGFKIFTGDPVENGQKTVVDVAYTSKSANNPKLRAGILYGGFRNSRFGVNSEGIRNVIQNGFHSIFGFSHFQVLDINRSVYFSVGTRNPYSLYE